MKLITVILLYITTLFTCYPQDIDTIVINYDKNYIRNLVKDSLWSRYNLTKSYDSNIVTEYPLDSLKFNIIPFFYFNQKKISKYKCVDFIEDYINFDVQNDKLKVVLDYKNEMIGYFLTQFFYDEKNPKDNSNYDILNKISFQTYTQPKIIDGQFDNINIFELRRFFFLFTLQPINAVCLIENGKIYVITAYKLGNYKKIALNEYIHEKYGKRGVRKIYSRNKKNRYEKCRKCNRKKDVSNGLFIKLNSILE
ncbi:hypothetical protein [uncultured Croceitalea sp.]|uniref:hypothetical protein n=1 Tax=uncultured Croceitalea sp. TaxID=1798908 RepID=UPI003305BF10